jgi:hypothetical protein
MNGTMTPKTKRKQSIAKIKLPKITKKQAAKENRLQTSFATSVMKHYAAAKHFASTFSIINMPTSVTSAVICAPEKPDWASPSIHSLQIAH